MNNNANGDIAEYRSSDIYFCAYICALGNQLKRTEVEDENKKKVIFVFDIPKKDLQGLKTSFFGGAGQVNAQKFVQALRSLKSICFI